MRPFHLRFEMLIEKEEAAWTVRAEDADNQLGLINMVRYLEKMNDEITRENPEKLVLSLDLEKLERVNSELIAQFVMLQSNLVRNNGRLKIINANAELRSFFDVVMLDKIINISYFGTEDGDSSSEE